MQVVWMIFPDSPKFSKQGSSVGGIIGGLLKKWLVFVVNIATRECGVFDQNYL